MVLKVPYLYSCNRILCVHFLVIIYYGMRFAHNSHWNTIPALPQLAVHEQSNVQHIQLANNTSVHLDSYLLEVSHYIT